MTDIKLALTGNLKTHMEEEIRLSGRAIQRAVKETTEDLKLDLRAQTTAAGLGRRLGNSWRSNTWPGNGPSMSAAGMVRTKAPLIMKAFTEGATIKSKDGNWLAIPTENAPKRGTDRKRINPSNFPEQRFGPLRFVYRRGQPSLLVVDGVKIGRAGRVGRQLSNKGKTKSGRYKKGVLTVVMFVMVPQVSIAKKINMRRAEAKAQRNLPRNILKHFKRLDHDE